MQHTLQVSHLLLHCCVNAVAKLEYSSRVLNLVVCDLVAMNGPLPAELKFRENSALSC